MAPRITVFVSGPGDVVEAKDAALRIIKEVSAGYLKYHDAVIEAFDQRSISSAIADTPQEAILHDPKFAQCDLLVVIFWRRYGTPVSRESGRGTKLAPTGTVCEYLASLARMKETGEPEIQVYFREVDKFCAMEPCRQLKQLTAFKDRMWKKDGLFYKEFRDNSQFEEMFRKSFEGFLRKKHDEAQSRDQRAGPPIFRGLVSECSLRDSAPDGMTDKFLYTAKKQKHIETRYCRIKGKAVEVWVAPVYDLDMPDHPVDKELLDCRTSDNDHLCIKAGCCFVRRWGGVYPFEA